MSAPYPPGQPQWPGNHPQRPDRPPPIQFRPEDPEPPRNKALEWSLRIAGLVAVAVISGLVWWYIQNDEPPAASSNDGGSSSESEGQYKLDPHEDVPTPKVDSTCPEHAYEDIREFLQSTPCDRLTRALYVTEVPDGRTVYVSVSVVRMADEAAAGQLRDLTDNDGTGNINDLVREGVVTIDGLKSLSRNDGYASTHQGRDVVIVEADFDPKAAKGADKKKDENLLDEVCTDALRKASEISGDAG